MLWKCKHYFALKLTSVKFDIFSLYLLALQKDILLFSSFPSVCNIVACTQVCLLIKQYLLGPRGSIRNNIPDIESWLSCTVWTTLLNFSALRWITSKMIRILNGPFLICISLFMHRYHRVSSRIIWIFLVLIYLFYRAN